MKKTGSYIYTDGGLWMGDGNRLASGKYNSNRYVRPVLAF